jgi:hypothetical protein
MKVIATSVRPLDLRQTAKGAGGQPLTNNRPVWPTRPRGDLGQVAPIVGSHFGVTIRLQENQ